MNCYSLTLPDGYLKNVVKLGRRVNPSRFDGPVVKLEAQTEDGFMGWRWTRLDDTCLTCNAPVSAHLETIGEVTR